MLKSGNEKLSETVHGQARLEYGQAARGRPLLGIQSETFLECLCIRITKLKALISILLSTQALHRVVWEAMLETKAPQ